ncbi:translocation and assembly module TamA [Rhodoblastus acidophilus]|uniref:autotransporter assembly complex protein TamA n=1 Tax=Rhodoblastus acidophilus TaxID=1074 RepID=UPI00222552A6|nr:BamA/TamA family outer membrane protein [Rhodoblastus acidophilus]MCW2318722.1 translocation and assembly module TamA [Rhodoblastus acidophilus]
MSLFRINLGARCLLAGLLLGGAPPWAPARAEGFLGLFGDDSTPPAPRPGALTYEVEIRASEDALADDLKDVSNSWRLKQQPVEDGESLARRVAADLPRMIDALWAEGFYDARVEAEVEGRRIDLGGAGVETAAAAANRAMGLQVARVIFAVTPGPRYVIGEVHLLDARTGAPLDDPALRAGLKLDSGDPARASAVRALQTRVVDLLRDDGRALAKVEKAEAIVRHDSQRVDIEVRVVPGPKAGFGAVTVKHDGGIDPAVIRSFIYVERGDPFSPERIKAMRRSIGQIEAIGTTRVLESERLDANGDLPMTVETNERKAHAVGLAAQYSTVDGPSVRGDWTFRNLFGDGERLRLTGIVGVTPDTGGDKSVKSVLDPQRLVGRFNAAFIKPALNGSRFDYLADFTLAREVTKSYSAEYGDTTQALRYRFNEALSVQGGIEVERGRSSDPFGKTDYLLVGVIGAVHYDTTDSLLDPRIGVRVLATGGAYPTFLGSSLNFYQGKAQVSSYYALDDDKDYVLAGRVALGASGGARVLDVPDNRRFFAGGGGSVRGFAYRSLSPMAAVPGQGDVAMGGASLFEASVEGRIKITDDIGLVPFVDAGAAFADSLPDFQSDMRFAGGLGLRYYTGFGPIRLDVATPINRRKGDPAFAVYLGIGQAF